MTQRVPIPLPVMGLAESVAADQQQPGTTARVLNMRGVDPREPGRVRLAQRSGLSPHGSGSQVAAGSAVVGMFQAVQDTPPERWVEHGTSGVVTEWSTALDARPVAVLTGPQGNGYTLLENGNVVIVTARGRILATVDSQVPSAFELVPMLGVDEDGAVYTMARYPRRIDGGAGRLYRLRERDGIWERESETVIEWSPRAFIYDRGEILFTASRPTDWDESAEADGIAPLERLYRYAGVKGGAFGVWEVPAAAPAVDLDVNERGDIYVASARNPSRVPTGSAPDTPSIGWIPREAASSIEGANASEALYMHLSALRAQSLQGLSTGARMASWVGATHDDSDFDQVIDGPTRSPSRIDAERAPTFDLNGMVGVPAVTFNEAQGFVSRASTGFHEKDVLQDSAQHAQTVFPNMRDASGQGAHFCVTMLFRIEAVPGGHTDTHYVFEQGDYALSYARNSSNIDFTLDYPGGSSTLTLTGLTARALVFSFVHAGNGDANSAWYLYDAATLYSATGLTVGINRALERTVIGGYTEMQAGQWQRFGGDEGALSDGLGQFGIDKGYRAGTIIWNNGRAYTCILTHRATPETEPGVGSSFSTYWTVVSKLGLKGAIAEIVTMLGGSSAATAPHDTATTTLMREKLEGFVANAYGRQGVLTAAHPYDTAPPAGAGDPIFSNSAGLALPQGITVKYSRADGGVMWVLGLNSGSGVAAAPNGYLYTGTLEGAAAGTIVRARRHRDTGRAVVTSGLDLFGVTDSTGDAWLGQRLNMASDACGDLYLPWVDADASTARSLRRYRANGLGGATVLFTYELGSSAYPVDLSFGGFQVDDRDTGGACGPEFAYVGSVNETNPVAPVYEVKRVAIMGRQATGSTAPRAVELLAITENGTVSRYASGAWTSVAATVLPGTMPWTATLFSKTFLGNGSAYRVYDHKNKTLRAFEAASLRGEIPPRCRLGTAWRGRLVLARGHSAHEWFMSALADPFDWDYLPDVPTETQAISASTSQVGEVPDLVNALIPWSDDLLIFGCDASIWRLTGDPMASGELHRVSDVTGVAFGQAWCKDPEQRIYFWGSRGGMFVMSPDGGVQPLSEGRIHRRLLDIDLARYTVRLAWNYLDEGVHAFFVPVDGKGEPRHYFWERKTGGWWEDQILTPERQVRSVFLADGDLPSDRRLLLGCADGRIRKWDVGAMDDDGEQIRASVLVGPIVPDTSDAEFRASALEVVLARDQGGCRVGMAGTPEADVPYHVGTTVDVNPGRNGYCRMRARGSALWIELASSELGQSFAVEDLAVHVAPSGRKRMR